MGAGPLGQADQEGRWLPGFSTKSPYGTLLYMLTSLSPNSVFYNYRIPRTHLFALGPFLFERALGLKKRVLIFLYTYA